MAGSAPEGTIARVRGALRSDDFRRLFAIRLAGQAGDGCFQAALVASVVFAPTEHSTTVGLFKAAVHHGAAVLVARAVRRGVHRSVARRRTSRWHRC